MLRPFYFHCRGIRAAGCRIPAHPGTGPAPALARIVPAREERHIGSDLHRQITATRL
jgi:hypothetical protein